MHRSRGWAEPLELAGRQSQARLHPVGQSALGITHGTAELDIRWAVASHPRLCQPRRANAQKFGCLRYGKQALSAVEIPSRGQIGASRDLARSPFSISRGIGAPAQITAGYCSSGARIDHSSDVFRGKLMPGCRPRDR
jgi:hypothetical protein